MINTSHSTSEKLEAAKERLRSVLLELEEIVEQKIADATLDAPAANKQSEHLQEKLQIAANENQFLKEENEKLTILHLKVQKRVDKMIEEVRQVIAS